MFFLAEIQHTASWKVVAEQYSLGVEKEEYRSTKEHTGSTPTGLHSLSSQQLCNRCYPSELVFQISNV